MDLVGLVLTLLLGIEVTISLVATAYIVNIHRPVSGQSPFYDRLVTRDVRVAISGAVIGAFALYSSLRFLVPELNLPPFVPPFGALLIGVPVIVLLWGPIADALAIRAERKK